MARRCHVWTAVEECDLNSAQLPQAGAGELPVPLNTLVREAARCWSKLHGQKLGDWRTPRLSPMGAARTVAQCFRHEACECFYEFTGHWKSDEKYCLVVRKSGECHDNPRQARRARSEAQNAKQPTTEQDGLGKRCMTCSLRFSVDCVLESLGVGFPNLLPNQGKRPRFLQESLASFRKRGRLLLFGPFPDSIRFRTGTQTTTHLAALQASLGPIALGHPKNLDSCWGNSPKTPPGIEPADSLGRAYKLTCFATEPVFLPHHQDLAGVDAGDGSSLGCEGAEKEQTTSFSQ